LSSGFEPLSALILRSGLYPPHPEEARSAVSKDGAATWFETRFFEALLTMRP
jgi:hypothetical protein